jgi:hypothetical protein
LERQELTAAEEAEVSIARGTFHLALERWPIKIRMEPAFLLRTER